MRDALELLALILIPAMTAGIVAFTLQRCWPTVAGRYCFAAAVAAGFLAGCLIFPDRLPLMPERHWHWLPCLGIAAALVGGVSVAGGVLIWERAILFGMIALVSAWQLVPTWDTLQPARTMMIPLLAGYLTVINLLLTLLPEHLRGRLFVAILAIASAAVAGLVMSEVSLRLGMLPLRIAAALIGCWLASWFYKSEAATAFAASTAALAPVYVVLTGGSLFVAAIEPSEPLFVLFLAPAAPLMLWLFAWGPLARLEGFAASIGQGAAVVSIPTVILAWLWLQNSA